MSLDHPVFAVVGHPNKGKSSVVAALTQNDEVRISPLSGTTRVSQHFSLKLDDRVVLELVDTPGFQRANRCLGWLRREEAPADQRPARTRAFVERFAGGDEFTDEVELLGPIVEGAGIIYVVDGSLPYSPEYEVEMEILRWSGRPRLALINPIGGDAFVEQWQRALNQYFSLVRVFDPLHAGFDQHLQLLRTFGQLDPERIERFERAAEELEHYRELKLEQAARIIVDNLHRLLTWQQERSPLPGGGDALLGEWAPDEIERFNQRLNEMEREGQRQLEALFLYHRLESAIARLEVHDADLMDQTHWSLWGLERGQLVVVATGAGAALGLAADAAVGGASLMAGALGGGVVGGLSGWFGVDRLKEKLPTWLAHPREQRLLGPIGDPNFAFVILGRALSHAHAMLARSHADRGKLDLKSEPVNRMGDLDLKTQVMLLKQCRKLAKEGPQGRAGQRLLEWIQEELAR